MGGMTRFLMNALPAWACILVYVLFFMSCASLIFFFVRKKLPHWVHKENNSYLPTIAVITSANYGFFLGFVVIVLWQSFNHAESLVSAEANHLISIVHHKQALAPTQEKELDQRIGKYVNLVVKKEWPVMRAGQSLPEAEDAAVDLLKFLLTVTPKTDGEKAFYVSLVKSTDAFLEKRHERIDAIESVLTEPLRFFLVLGTFIITFLLSLLSERDKSVHVVCVSLVIMVIAFNVSIAFNLDFPFSGEMSVSSTPFSTGALRPYLI